MKNKRFAVCGQKKTLKQKAKKKEIVLTFKDEHTIPNECPQTPKVSRRSRRHLSHRRQSSALQVPAIAEPRSEASLLPRQCSRQWAADSARNQSEPSQHYSGSSCKQ